MLTKCSLPLIEDTILLIGETGVGKSTLAKWIHSNSILKNEKFIPLNIASLSEQLFESELFGHKKGSFTGATFDKKGFCEIVGQGTLFLDEIGDLSFDLQKKLLTLLDEGIYYPVGSTCSKKFNGKLIVATHKNLFSMTQKGKFRKDLYYRLCGFQYEIKPLRERENKKSIIYNEIEKELTKSNKRLSLTECVKDFLLDYEFPGNFRELKQIVRYLSFVSVGEISKSALPGWITACNRKSVKSDNYYDALESFERDFLVEKLKKYRGKINFTAGKINISKVTLISKIKKYDINIPQLKLELFNGI